MDYFTNCIQLGQTTEYAGQASEYIKKIESSKNAKPYYANVSLGQQYDSNVVLTPDGIPLTKGLASKSDFKTLLFLDARYKFIDSGAIEASAGYNFNQAFNYRLSSFNVTRNLADLYMMANVSPVVGLGAQYKLEYILLAAMVMISPTRQVPSRYSKKTIKPVPS